MSPAELDRAALLCARTRGPLPALERAAAVYSRSGEHGACWLALAGVGVLLDRRPGARARWLRGGRIVLAAYGLNYAVKLRSAGAGRSSTGCRR